MVTHYKVNKDIYGVFCSPGQNPLARRLSFDGEEEEEDFDVLPAMAILANQQFIQGIIGTYCAGEFTKRVQEMSSWLFVTLYTLYVSIYPSANKQLRRHLPNPFHKIPSS